MTTIEILRHMASLSYFGAGKEILHRAADELEALQKENETIKSQLRFHIDLLETLLAAFDERSGHVGGVVGANRHGQVDGVRMSDDFDESETRNTLNFVNAWRCHRITGTVIDYMDRLSESKNTTHVAGSNPAAFTI